MAVYNTLTVNSVNTVMSCCSQTLLTSLQKKHQKFRHQKEADDDDLETPPQYQGAAYLHSAGTSKD